MTLGKRLQQLRCALSLSQEEFGEKLGVSRQTISKWELDQSLPELAKIVQISRMFSVTTDSLLIDGITSFDIPQKDFVCGIYRGKACEIVETERFSLVLEKQQSLLVSKLYVGHHPIKHLWAIVVRDGEQHTTQYAYQTNLDGLVSNAHSLAGQIGECYHTEIIRGMLREERFAVDSSQTPLPTVSEVGLKNALSAWRNGTRFVADGEQLMFSLCTPSREYAIHINMQGTNIYCCAMFNTVFDMGLFAAGQYFRIRHYKDNTEPFCGFYGDFTFLPETTAPKTNTNGFSDGQKNLAYTIKRYSDDEIVLDGCGDDEFAYRRNQEFVEQYTF